MLPVIYSDEFLQHNTGNLHPEKPERLTAIVQALKTADFADQIQWRSPTPINQRTGQFLLETVHSSEYIKKVQELAQTGGGNFYADTIISPKSYDVAMLTVSAWLDGIDEVLTKNFPAFVAARPPGHHALKDTGMGFCLFANAAIAANYALTKPGINRVAILDWDVHHGNGTQAAVENNPHIAFTSIHQSPFFPFTGREEETGIDNNVLNVRVLQGSTIAEYQPIFREKIIPFLTNFQPDILIVSAGYDANQADKLGWVNLQPQDYGLFTKYCLQITPKIVFGLEGGYELNSLANSVVATIEACLKTII
ncbi:MAG: histone deacetylase [Nostocales cyanobacterium]|nr:MAG: histone deacetylase [Nostocales cyanobacterium]